MPWWALGASGMSSNLDVAGTMTIVAMITLYGLQGFWIEMRGGVVLPIAVFLAFMGKSHRRSGVMTTAEWMELRFGAGRSGRVARVAAAMTDVVITVARIVFFVSAGGRFLAAFLPFTETQCSVGIALVALAYTLVGGLAGVIWTDVVQTVLIGGAAAYVAFTASGLITPGLLAAWPGAALNQLAPRPDDPPGLEPYAPFVVFLVVWAGKGVLEGLGGSGGSAYMARRFYAARSDEDCRRIGMLWTILFAARWPMVPGFAVLAMHLGPDVRDATQAEAVLPQVLASEHFPPGVRGLMIAAMLAAAMSTFDSTINAGASYLVRDVFMLARPAAGRRAQVWAGYAASALLVAAGLGLAHALGASVLGLWVGIVMLLFPAFLVPFALRWYWARFNGAGFTAGIGGGFAAAVAFLVAGARRVERGHAVSRRGGRFARRLPRRDGAGGAGAGGDAALIPRARAPLRPLAQGLARERWRGAPGRSGDAGRSARVAGTDFPDTDGRDAPAVVAGGGGHGGVVRAGLVAGSPAGGPGEVTSGARLNPRRSRARPSRCR